MINHAGALDLTQTIQVYLFRNLSVHIFRFSIFFNSNFFDPVPCIDKNRLKLGMLIEIEIFEKVKIEPFPKFKYRYLQTQLNIFFHLLIILYCILSIIPIKGLIIKIGNNEGFTYTIFLFRLDKYLFKW